MNEKIITYKKLINDEISKIHFSDKPKKKKNGSIPIYV